jgi:hypothetical protein
MYQDFKDLLHEFDVCEVEFLIVGAHALAAHGLIRATKDLDIWIRPSLENAPRVYRALAIFGADLQDLTVEDLQKPEIIYQMGVEPIRIDVLTVIDGVNFDEAWNDRIKALLDDQPVWVISREHLIKNKKAAGREKDLLDVKWLQQNPPNPTA